MEAERLCVQDNTLLKTVVSKVSLNRKAYSLVQQTAANERERKRSDQN